MNTFQLDRLPTLLAYPLARYQQTPVWDPRALFLIVEILLIYAEDLLRAQLRDDSELKRPVAMGQRVERCLLLSNRLRKLRREPLVELVKENEENADLRLLITTRNHWVHSGPVLKADRSKLDNAMERLLSEVERASIAVVQAVSGEEITANALVGMSGLFGGHPILLHQEAGRFVFRSDGPALIAVPPEGLPIDLFPYLIYEVGGSGENRVMLLTRISGGKPEYLDPFEVIGSQALG